jgi:hypothetical protein
VRHDHIVALNLQFETDVFIEKRIQTDIGCSYDDVHCLLGLHIERTFMKRLQDRVVDTDFDVKKSADVGMRPPCKVFGHFDVEVLSILNLKNALLGHAKFADDLNTLGLGLHEVDMHNGKKTMFPKLKGSVREIFGISDKEYVSHDLIVFNPSRRFLEGFVLVCHALVRRLLLDDLEGFDG